MNGDQKLIATVIIILVVVAVYTLYGPYLKAVFLNAGGAQQAATASAGAARSASSVAAAGQSLQAKLKAGLIPASAGNQL